MNFAKVILLLLLNVTLSEPQSNGCIYNPALANPAAFGVSSQGDYTSISFMEPVPPSSYIYECQNSTLYLGVFNVSLRAYDAFSNAKNVYVNTVTCSTTVPAGPAANIFDVTTYNSCDDAGACGNCGGCNCTCRVNSPWWWNCCQDPCFGCAHCCNCAAVQWNGAFANPGSGSCLQCGSDGWYASNGQMLTPTLCQFALAATNPNNRLDFESLASSNFSYQVRILQRAIGVAASTALALANLTVYVRDCNEWPIFTRTITGTSIYQYEGITGSFAGPLLNVQCRDPDIYTPAYSQVSLNVQRVTLTNVGNVNPIPFYITNPNFQSSNGNMSVLMYDASRCGGGSQACLDMFTYAYSGAAVPIFTVFVTAIDGGGLVSTYSYSVTVLNTPTVPQWLNLPQTISVVEGTPGPTQIFPMQAIVPGFNAAVNTVQFMIVNVAPTATNAAGAFFGTTFPCNPAAASAVQCAGLSLTAAVGPNTLNYTTQNQYNVTVWLTNQVSGGATPTIQTISSSIIVNIIQLIYQPRLVKSNDTIFIRENVTGQACFYTISGATSINGHTNFLYTFTAPPIHNAFYLNGNAICYDGSRQASGPASAPNWIFDFGQANQYTLQVTVSDPLSSMTPPTLTLTVNIVNVENPLELFVPQYQYIPETAANWDFQINATKEVNMSAITFTLTSQSAANNNQMWFISSQQSTVASPFASAIVNTTNSVIPPPIFNYSVAPIIFVYVRASTPGYTVSATITCLIQRINMAPRFTNLPNQTSIAESITGFVTIFTIFTSDRENDPRTVFFRDPTTGALTTYDPTNRFYIDPGMRTISTNIGPGQSGFDYMVQPVYNLTIVVVDDPPSPLDPRTSTSTFLVYLVLNQTAPTFTQPLPGANSPNSTIVPHVLENVVGQRYLFTLAATDREGDRIYYNITSVEPSPNRAFRIPPSSNLVEYNINYATTQPMFDYARNPVYYIIIECSDQKTTPTSTTTLTVSIDRVDKPARWTSLPAMVSVREDVFWGPTDLVTIQAIDPNGGIYPVTYRYIGITPVSGAGRFYFDNTTMTVGYNQNPGFAYGVVNSYVMSFAAWNTVNPTVTSSLVVNIIKVPTGPNVNSSGIVYIHENVTLGQTLWDMRAKSNTSALTYQIIDINPDGFSKFQVTPQGLIRSVNQPNFNYREAPEYVIKTQITDALGMSTTFTLTVSLLDDPEPPVITNMPGFASVREGPVGVVFGGLYTANCVDRDNRQLSWRYNVLPNVGYNSFSISQTGVISTTAQANFTYAVEPYYYVVAYCSNGFYTATGTLTVIVVWTTSTSTTTASPRQTRPDELLVISTEPSGDILQPWQIGVIVGCLLGALLLALGAWGLAVLMQRRARREGITESMKGPKSTMRETKV